MKYVYTITTNDSKFQRALINFLNDYPMNKPNSIAVHIGELKDETENPKARLSLVDHGR